MMLRSCVNCCHNPLQTDLVGTTLGYCTEHKKLLLQPSQLTCGRHFRKDVLAKRAIEEREHHQQVFSPAMIARLADSAKPANGGYTSDSKADVHRLASDEVADAALDYGRLPTKMASLAQFRRIRGARAEIALLSLGRAYVNRCVTRGGEWTSGVHVFWWTRGALLEAPTVEVSDFRVEASAELERQFALAQWSIIMMRLIFISDIGAYARSVDARMGRLATLAEQAAEKSGELSPKSLLRWLRRDGIKAITQAMPEDRYERLSAELRARPSEVDEPPEAAAERK